MKKLDIIEKQLQEKTLKHSLKRKKFCKFTKGEHRFILVIPEWDCFKKYKTTKEFYHYWNSERESCRLFGKSFFYKCELCGKKKTKYKELST